MKHLIIIPTLTALAFGRPEPPSEYSYNVPATSFEYPSSGGLQTSKLGLLVSAGGRHSYTLTSSEAGLYLESSGHGVLGTGLGSSTGGGLGSQGLSLTQSVPSSGIFLADNGIATSPGNVVVQKHIYVHVPPPEQEEYRPPRVFSVSQPQKHYKIIFIKAPTAPTPTAPSIPLQPQNEEKTLVYVLVKKPEEAPEIHIPQPQPTQPSKPEVYFIRYKTQKENDPRGGLLAESINGASGIAGSSLSGASAISDVSLGDALSGAPLVHGLIESSVSSVSSSSLSNSLSGSYGVPSTRYGHSKHGH